MSTPASTSALPRRQLAMAGAGAIGLASISAFSAALTGFNALVSVRPGAPPPQATVVSVQPSPRRGYSLRLTLTGPGADEPGWVGVLATPGRLLAGPIVHRDPSGAVTRDGASMPGIEEPLLEAGAAVTVTADPWVGCEDPLGLGEATQEVPTSLGPLPVTSVGTRRSRRAVVFVHGRGGVRATGWWIAPVCAAAGWRCVMAAYRNDADGGPATGRYLLGGEWVDLVAVLDHLAADGVEEVVLAGWSMGGNICASYLRQRHRRPERFAHHPDMVGLVLDAPALDWGTVLGHIARTRRLPRGLVPLAMTYGQVIRRVDWRDLNHLADPEHLTLPVLAYHGVEDTAVPLEVSEHLAENLDDVQLETFPSAGHCRSVNLDPDRYLEALAHFLDRLSPVRPPRGGPPGAVSSWWRRRPREDRRGAEIVTGGEGWRAPASPPGGPALA
jgi:uncharacterized protein